MMNRTTIQRAKLALTTILASLVVAMGLQAQEFTTIFNFPEDPVPTGWETESLFDDSGQLVKLNVTNPPSNSQINIDPAPYFGGEFGNADGSVSNVELNFANGGNLRDIYLYEGARASMAKGTSSGTQIHLHDGAVFTQYGGRVRKDFGVPEGVIYNLEGGVLGTPSHIGGDPVIEDHTGQIVIEGTLNMSGGEAGLGGTVKATGEVNLSGGLMFDVGEDPETDYYDVGNYWTFEEGSTLNQSGGIMQAPRFRHGANVNMTGGLLTGAWVNIFDHSVGFTLHLRGGTVEDSALYGTTEFTGGRMIHNELRGTVNVKGGAFGPDFMHHLGWLMGWSDLQRAGGTYGPLEDYYFFTSLNVHGDDFMLDGVPIDGLDALGDRLVLDFPEDSVLRGVLMDGSPFVYTNGGDFFRNATLRLIVSEVDRTPVIDWSVGSHEYGGVHSGQTFNLNGSKLRLSSFEDLSQMSTAPDQNGPSTLLGRNLADDTLHFRVFDIGGTMVVDKPEADYPEKTEEIARLKRLMAPLWGTRLWNTEKAEVLRLIELITGAPHLNGWKLPDFFRVAGGATLNVNGGKTGKGVIIETGATVNVNAGGFDLSNDAKIESGITFNQTGGTIRSNPRLKGSTINLSGGTGSIIAEEACTVTKTGGGTGVFLRNSSEMLHSGGGGLIQLEGSANLQFTGSGASILYLYGSSTAVISGGDFPSTNLPITWWDPIEEWGDIPVNVNLLSESTTAMVVGTRFWIDDVEITDTMEEGIPMDLDLPIQGSTLKAELLDGNTFINTLSVYDAAGDEQSWGGTMRLLKNTTGAPVPREPLPPVVTLLGDAEITHYVGDSFDNPGATAWDRHDGDLSVQVSGDFDPDQPGAYVLTYAATDSSGNFASVTRTVHVVDITPPVVTALGEATLNHEAATPYVDAGATSTDNVDGDLSASIMVTNPVDVATLGAYTVTYSSLDSSGNEGTATRTVVVADTTAPVITLVDGASMTHEAATPYVDPGATASDTLDGDLTPSIVVSNGVDAGALGSYTVRYNVTDSQGLAAAEVTRTVNVVDTTPPVITLLGENPVNLVAGETYIEPGATALDSLEGDLSGSVTVSGTVNTLVHGTNVLTYHVTDGSGNAATPVTRTVLVDGDEPPVFDEATVAVAIDERTTGMVHRAAAGDPDGGVRFDHPGYVALFPTDEGTGAGVVDALGSGLELSFIAQRWAVDATAPGGENVLNTAPQIVGGVKEWFTVDDFNVTNGLTVSEWVRFDNIQSSIYDPVIWKFGDLRMVDYDGTLGLIGPGQTRVASPFVDGEWAHLIFSIGADGNYTVYLNGAELYSGQTTFDSSLTENLFGHDWATLSSGLQGARSDLSIIDGTLGATQAEMLYQSALNGHRGDVLRYRLGTNGGDEGFFTIDAYSGEMSLDTVLNHETPADADGDNVYRVEVIATDDEGLSGSQIVEFSINNSNIAPVITGSLLDPIEEVNGYYVYDFTVVDGDTAPEDLILSTTDNRFMVSSDGAGGYRVHRQNWHRFDYEGIQDYDFELVVSDGAEEARADIAFSLVNINDNAPVVSFAKAELVAENDPGAVLGVFTISDADGDETFHFSFDSRFELAADNRTLKLKDAVALDYESEPSVRVDVLIADRPIEGGDYNPAFYNGTIAVNNVNDVAPHDLQLVGQVVEENDPGAVIGILSAVDEDGPGLSFGVSDARFEVQGEVLKLAEGEALDREATAVVGVSVTASDGDFEATRTFTITVLNVDEGAPENIALSNASIAENSTGVIGELSATDVDGDAITFSVTDRRFEVTGTTLELTRPLNFEGLTDGTLLLDVTATGGGAATTQTLQITVEDVNEAPDMSLTAGPSSGLTDSLYLVPVMENVRQVTYTEPGDPGATQWPLSFVASDVDGDALSWVLAGADAAAFTVDAVTGALLFVDTPDFEAPGDEDEDGVYEVSVSVSDSDLSSRTISLVLTLVDIVDEGTAFDDWIGEFYPDESDPGIVGMSADPNGDGWNNALTFVLAMSPRAYHEDLLPTLSQDDAYFIYEYARSDRALDLDPGVEYCPDMSTWTRAVDGQNGVIIEVEDNGFGEDASGSGIDKVTVKIPRNGLNQLFCQLVVEG